MIIKHPQLGLHTLIMHVTSDGDILNVEFGEETKLVAVHCQLTTKWLKAFCLSK